MTRLLHVASAAVALAFATGAGAQAPPATYQGVDRAERLAAAAKGEGKLTPYSSIAEKDEAERWTRLFEATVLR
jgi:hypothetical protein